MYFVGAGKGKDDAVARAESAATLKASAWSYE